MYEGVTPHFAAPPLSGAVGIGSKVTVLPLIERTIVVCIGLYLPPTGSAMFSSNSRFVTLDSVALVVVAFEIVALFNSVGPPAMLKFSDVAIIVLFQNAYGPCPALSEIAAASTPVPINRISPT